MTITPLEMESIKFTPNRNNSATARKSNNKLQLKHKDTLRSLSIFIQNANEKPTRTFF